MKFIILAVVFMALLTEAKHHKCKQCVLKATKVPCKSDGSCSEAWNRCVTTTGNQKSCIPVCSGFAGTSCPPDSGEYRYICCFEQENGQYNTTIPYPDAQGLCLKK